MRWLSRGRTPTSEQLQRRNEQPLNDNTFPVFYSCNNAIHNVDNNFANSPRFTTLLQQPLTNNLTTALLRLKTVVVVVIVDVVVVVAAAAVVVVGDALTKLQRPHNNALRPHNNKCIIRFTLAAVVRHGSSSFVMVRRRR